MTDGGYFGSVATRKFGGSLDAEDFKVGGAAEVFSDPNAAERNVDGVSTTNPVGGLICTDGYTDREICSVKILSDGASCKYDGKKITNLVKAFQRNGIPAFSPGDSGGPVYTTLKGGGVNARGMIVAHTGNLDGGYYEKVTTIESSFKVKVVTVT